MEGFHENFYFVLTFLTDTWPEKSCVAKNLIITNIFLVMSLNTVSSLHSPPKRLFEISNVMLFPELWYWIHICLLSFIFTASTLSKWSEGVYISIVLLNKPHKRCFLLHYLPLLLICMKNPSNPGGATNKEDNYPYKRMYTYSQVLTSIWVFKVTGKKPTSFASLVHKGVYFSLHRHNFYAHQLHLRVRL